MVCAFVFRINMYAKSRLSHEVAPLIQVLIKQLTMFWFLKTCIFFLSHTKLKAHSVTRKPQTTKHEIKHISQRSLPLSPSLSLSLSLMHTHTQPRARTRTHARTKASLFDHKHSVFFNILTLTLKCEAVEQRACFSSLNFVYLLEQCTQTLIRLRICHETRVRTLAYNIL